jgi:hypothetical protein
MKESAIAGWTLVWYYNCSNEKKDHPCIYFIFLLHHDTHDKINRAIKGKFHLLGPTFPTLTFNSPLPSLHPLLTVSLSLFYPADVPNTWAKVPKLDRSSSTIFEVNVFRLTTSHFKVLKIGDKEREGGGDDKWWSIRIMW